MAEQRSFICVRPSEGNFEVIQLELGEDNSVLVETLVKHFPNARGLYYYNPDNSLIEVPRFREKLFPPIYGFQVVYFTMLYQSCNSEDRAKDLKVEIFRIENLEDQAGKLKDQLKLLEEEVKNSKATTNTSVKQLIEEIIDIRLKMKKEKAINLEETGLLRKEIKTLRIKLDKGMSLTKDKLKQETILRKDGIELEKENLNKDLVELKKETANIRQNLIEIKINHNHDQNNNTDKTSPFDNAPKIISEGKGMVTNPKMYSSDTGVDLQVPRVSKEYFEKDDMVKVIGKCSLDTVVKRMDIKSNIVTMCSLDNSDDEVQPQVKSKEPEHFDAGDKRLDTQSNDSSNAEVQVPRATREPECLVKDDAEKAIEIIPLNTLVKRMDTKSNIDISKAGVQDESVAKEPQCFVRDDALKAIEKGPLDTFVKRMDTKSKIDSSNAEVQVASVSNSQEPEYFVKDIGRVQQSCEYTQNIIGDTKSNIYDSDMYSSDSDPEYFEKVIEKGPLDTVIKRIDTKSNIFTLCSSDDSDDEVQPHLECATKEPEYLVKDDMVKLKVIERVQQNAGDKRMDTQSKVSNSSHDVVQVESEPEYVVKYCQHIKTKKVDTSNIHNSDDAVESFKDHVCNTRCACMVGLDNTIKQSFKESENNVLGGKTDWIPMEERLLQKISSDELRSNETVLPSKANLGKKASVTVVQISRQELN